MEYVNYVLIILGILLVCLYFIRIPGVLPAREAQLDLAAGKRPGAKNKPAKGSQREAEKAILQRETMKVPIPWGWPGSQQRTAASRFSGSHTSEANGVSESLQRWVDHMVSSKPTVTDESYRRRKEASVRALLEDRYGRPSQPGGIRYEKTKPLLLRDPSRPHDQMDNFPSGKLKQIESGLKKQQPAPGTSNSPAKKPRFEVKKELRTPWGW